MDQPIYAIAKQIQWKGTDTLVHDKLVLMLGALQSRYSGRGLTHLYITSLY